MLLVSREDQAGSINWEFRSPVLSPPDTRSRGKCCEGRQRPTAPQPVLASEAGEEIHW